MRIPKNRKDPSGYYEELGVLPWATEDEIKTAVRRLLFELHPDTADEPDVERLQRVKLISEVLLDPITRDRYNHTPPGKRLMDQVYYSELSRIDGLVGLDDDQLTEVLKPQKANPYQSINSGTRYDYFAIEHDYFDGLKAQLWYHHLLVTAPMVRYRSVIKVLIYDGPAFYDYRSRIMSIPRRWEPSSAGAYALLTHVAGFLPGGG